jgi:mono/diheme cytochrome c family protein
MSAFASLRRRSAELAAVAFTVGAAAQTSEVPASAPHAFLDTACVKCHSEEAESAMALFSGFFLDRLDVANVAAHPAEWEKVVRKLRTGMMPPASEPRPDEAQRQAFIAYLEGALDELGASTRTRSTIYSPSMSTPRRFYRATMPASVSTTSPARSASRPCSSNVMRMRRRASRGSQSATPT